MAEVEWRTHDPDPQLIDRLERDCRLHRLIARVLAARGVRPEDAEDFLHPRLQNLADPYELPGMEAAAARLWQAIHDREHILIHGDYDADGITSAVLLEWVLQENGAEVDCFLPHRLNDGYGLTVESIDRAMAERHKLLVTVDCGITSVAAAAMAKDMGVEVIITDHHEPGDEIPEALAVINPKLHAHLAALHNLAGVGVCFKLCHAFIKYGREHNLGGMNVDLRDGLDLVALGTVADIVPLRGENRTLVRHGISVLSAQRRPGIRALCDITGLNESVRPEDIAFRLTPRLNAAGRLGDPVDALHLLRATSIVDAYPLARALDECNRKRQQLEGNTFNAAIAQIEQLNLQDRHTLVVQGQDWHPGVIGIVASRLTQTFSRPAIVLSMGDGGEMQGSGRGVPGVNLVAALDHCRDLLLRYGGHPMAIGLSLRQDLFEPFCEQFERAIRDVALCAPGPSATLETDGEALLLDLDDRFFDQLEWLQPFGHDNEPPSFLFPRVSCRRVLSAGRNNTRGTLEDERGGQMSFIAFGITPGELPPQPWDIVATPQLNFYRGTCSRQVLVQEFRPAR